MGLFGKRASKPGAPAPVMPVAPVPVQHIAHFDGAKFKIQLRLGRTRIEVQRTKRENSIINNRRTAADHLRGGKDELARIFAEKTLRERSQLEAYDIVMTYVELLIESAQLVKSYRTFDSAPADVKESVASLVYAVTRMSVAELRSAADMLRAFFGAAVVDPIARGDDAGPHLHCVNRLLAIKLDATSPDPALVRAELIAIAADHNVSWTAPPDTYGGVQPPYNPNPYAGPPPNAPPSDFGYPPPPGGGYGPPGGGYGPPGGGYGPPGGGGGGGYAPAHPGHNTAAPVNPAAIPGMAASTAPAHMPPAYAPQAPPVYPTAPAPYAPQAPRAPPPPPPPATSGHDGIDSDDFMARLNNLKNN